ncbi:TrmH family RNA methyltransferase [Jeotgalibacillus haloalkalitolerans]|uniref:RNA methyltransferase n=1 Tax=Jeotgalibacillus haloalkalitolerans TaxID=3104292 RepID=A0ABU5KMC4_9BACL|nr:RNA methyltransferase [Jeotgalibacillus sp. HH7-29]MDZ5712418.1 RNA methyltransferase [Jeotgalibacillus sp. HH7-29]
MNVIQSLQNTKVKEWKKLTTKKGRDKSGLFLVEGWHLTEEAIKADAVTEAIVKEGIELPPYMDSVEIHFVTEEISLALAETEHTQGVFAVCRQPEAAFDALNASNILMLDAIQDPGNIGTMIRTADAAGIDAVILGKGTADPYNAKVLRSAQGSHFHLPILKQDLLSVIEHCKESGIPVYGTSLQGAVTYKEAAPVEKFALIMGNEGAGVNSELLTLTDQNLYIPIYGKSESLNVAIAAGILLYHLKGE